MARPSIPNQRKQYKELEKRIRSYALLVEDIYDSLAEEAADIALRTGFDPASGRPFRFSDYPATADRVRTLQSRMADEIEAVIYRGTSAEWAASNEVQNLLATGVLKEYTGVIDRQKYRVLFQENSDALRAFRDRVDKGMTISDKLWEQSGSMRTAMEEAISCAIRKGTSAVTLSKRISQYLQDYPKLATDYGKKYGVAATAGDCEYRSIRLAASEINMAYRNAENERWAQMDFVVGYEIKLSSNHNCKGVKTGHFYDICDELAGKYPKNFKWSGWHPMCYSDDTYVLTDSGWKLFKEVDDGDKIMSLNPDTFHVEWVGFTDRQVYGYDGKMIRFYNSTYDCLVTPDHKMVYFDSESNTLKKCTASLYSTAMGLFVYSRSFKTPSIDFACKHINTEFVQYSGKVYDLTLERNHIMLVMRNEKFTWGSNCRCYKVPILKTEEEFWAWDGRSVLSSESKNSVNNYPDAYVGWINKNAERIVEANKKNTLPYFIKDNNKDLVVEYAKYLTDKNYKNIRINLINGGLKATHIDHSFDKKTGKYEKAVQNVGFKNGYRVILEAENHTIANVKNTDGLWDNKKFEIASVKTGSSSNVRNALKHCASKPGCDIAVLYAPTGISKVEIREGLSRYNGLRNTSQWKEFIDIYIIDEDGIKHLPPGN